MIINVMEQNELTWGGHEIKMLNSETLLFTQD